MLRQAFLDVDVGNEVCVRYDNAVGLALHQSAYRCVAHAGRHDTIHGGRRAAALDVAEDGNAGVDAGRFVDLVCDLLCGAVALCDDDDVVVAALDAAARAGRSQLRRQRSRPGARDDLRGGP